MDCQEPIVDDPKVDCSLSVVAGDGQLQFQGRAGAEVRGRSSQRFPKLNYAVELRQPDGTEQPTDLLGMGQEADWIFDGQWADRSMMRSALVFDLYQGLGGVEHYAAEGRFCELDLDGAPMGIYRLVERVKRAGSRIDIARDDGSGQRFVIKQDDEGSIRWSTGEQDHFKLIHPTELAASEAQRTAIQAWVDQLDRALRDGDVQQPGQGVFALLDLDSLVDWVLIEELSKNIDAYNLSLHFFRGADGLGRLVPWDFDLSMGQPNAEVRGARNEAPEGWSRRGWLMIDPLVESELFRRRLAERWHLHREGPFASQRIEALVDRYLDTLDADAVERNFELWPIEEVDFSFIYAPYSFDPVASFGEEVTRLRSWLRQRLAWIDTHIDGFPAE